MSSLVNLLQQVPKNDCVVVLGDFNEQYYQAMCPTHSKWTYGFASQNADKLLEVMRMFDLYTISTHFQPKRGSTNTTYTFCAEGSFDPTEEVEDLVGQEVIARYKGKRIKGVVKSKFLKKDKQLLKIKFDDGYVVTCVPKKPKR